MEKKEEKNFEELIEELEEITTQLENDKLTLDDSVKLFEKGMKISKDCNEKLENAEKRITILLNTEDGEIKEENFIPNDGE
jgi:exodeoxyribonuclease VII small subunit